MAAKLTFKEKWMRFWGLNCKVNFRSKEIHRLNHKHIHCNTDEIADGKFVTQRKAFRLLEEGFNGCYYCWKAEDDS